MVKIRFIGFCGIDDTVDASLLQLISCRYQFVEWGVLFRPDKEGEPRYLSQKGLDALSKTCLESLVPMNLAAHLCGSRCQDLIEGDRDFVRALFQKGFRRVQINATNANNTYVDPKRADEYAENIRKCMIDIPELEFIIQCNDETRIIWHALKSNPPSNMSMLFDSSCGLGVSLDISQLEALKSQAPDGVPIGYAGGIGPANITEVLSAVFSSRSDSDKMAPWIDMESSLRMNIVDKSTAVSSLVTTTDCFSIEKCFQCLQAGVALGLPVSI